MSAPSEGDGSLMKVNIAEGATSLKVLGYLELGAHMLEIGKRVIKVLFDDLILGHQRVFFNLYIKYARFMNCIAG
jgi:hypothetical protein